LVVGNTNSDHHLARFVLALIAANTAYGGKRRATCLVGGLSVMVLLAFKIVFGSAAAFQLCTSGARRVVLVLQLMVPQERWRTIARAGQPTQARKARRTQNVMDKMTERKKEKGHKVDNKLDGAVEDSSQVRFDFCGSADTRPVIRVAIDSMKSRENPNAMIG
jgi:hypothetical protein